MSRVLLVGPTQRLFSPGNLPWLGDTARALRRLGHEPVVVPYGESWAASSALAAARRVPGAARWLQRYQDERQHQRQRRLIRLARRLRPDLAIFLKGEVFDGDTLAEVRRASRGPLVTWWVDDPWRYPAVLRHLSVFDHVFIFDRSYLAPLTSAGASRVHFLPCGCDETVYRPLTLTAAEHRRLSCDVSFVGWWYPERSAVIQALAGAVDLGIWGGGWSGALDGCVRGKSVDSRTVAKIYNASKIGLNVHQAQTKVGGLNARTFELLASGLFQLVDWVQGLEELLRPDEDVVCYRSPEDARRLAKRYLADPSARARIATRGRERVLAEHTYVCRMRTLLDVARG